MLKSSSSVRSIYHTSINQFGYLCGASYPSSQHLLPLISFEALQSSAVFCHSRHVSNFTQLCWISSKPYLYLPDELSPSYPHLQESFQSRNDIPMAKGHWYRSCSHHPRFVFSTPTMSGSQKGSWIQIKVNMYVIISEQLDPAHSWTRCLLELHVHHCLGEPRHLLFPRLGGFPLLIGTWRS